MKRFAGRMDTNGSMLRLLSVAALPAMVIALSLPATGFAQNETGIDEWEYEPGEGLHKEEWYDPGDWFTDSGEEGIHYETDDWGYDYNYPHTNYDDDRDYGWYYDRAENDWDYGWHYEYYTDDWYDDDGVFDTWYDEY